jgi:hypothetical protein
MLLSIAVYFNVFVVSRQKFAKKRFDDRYLWKPTPEIETASQRAIFWLIQGVLEF